jgi:hypothetical protein
MSGLFGLTTLLKLEETQEHTHYGVQETLRWLAPELLAPENPAEDIPFLAASDTYAFGLLCYAVVFM